MTDPAGSNRSGITRRAILSGLGASSVLVTPLRPSAAAIVNLVAIGQSGWLFPVWDEVRRVDLQRIQGVAQLVNQAIGILKQANIEVMIPLTPVKSRVYREFLPDDFKFSSDTDRRYAVILEELRRPGTLVPDLAAQMTNARKTPAGDPLYFKADTHWTAAGAEVVATEVANQVKAKLRLQPSGKPGTRLGPYVTLEQGKNDLADLLPAPEASKYPLETYRIHQAAGGEGQTALIENDAAETVVIGNSYMQPKYGFAAMLSNQLGRPVSLTWKVNQFGPYKTLLIYLKSEAFHLRRPKLMVWQFHESNMTQPPDSRDAWGQNAMAAQTFLTELRQSVAA
jgi:alginate O-acetyltransferase complex protein AlgJ